MKPQVGQHRWSRLRDLLASTQLVELASAQSIRVRQPWCDLSGLDVVRSLLVQIAVIGNARTGYRFDLALRESGRMAYLIDRGDAESALHIIARACGVRFVGEHLPNTKVTAWCAILHHMKGIGGLSAFQEQLDELCRDSGSSLEHDRTVREKLLGLKLPMIGRKSWSDWLNNRGLTRHLLAIDTRLVGVWRRHLCIDVELEDFQDQHRYTDWENACAIELAQPLGITLSELDKRLFVLPTVIGR
jgi:hypothetical protein